MFNKRETAIGTAKRWVVATAIAVVGAAGCAGMDPDELGSVTSAQLVPVDGGGPGSGGPDGTAGLPPACKAVTVTGKVYYNDLRRYGRFADRRTILPGISGARDDFASSTDKQNYLGLWDAKVTLYEVDRAYLTNASSCSSTSYLGSTYIANDGTWSWSGTVCDACRIDADDADGDGVSIAAMISLENCASPGTRCFSVDDPMGQAVTNHYTDTSDWGATWSRWYHGATSTAPKVVTHAGTVDLGVDYFQTTYGLTAGYSSDLAAQAANLFATMVDVTRRVHIDEHLPFDHTSYGQIRAYFPSVTGGIAHSHEADRLCVTAPSDWLDGDEAAHEYGHLTHFWAWGGVGKWSSFCYDSDGDGTGDCDESYSDREYPIAAFKEGWAQFIRRVTFDGANVGLSCASIDHATPDAPLFVDGNGDPVCALTSSLVCTQGKYFADDVEQALCDLYDPVETDNPSLNDDRLQISLLDLQDNLTRMWTEASGPERSDVLDASAHHSFNAPYAATASLGLCWFAQNLVDSGIDRALLTETLGATWIDCGL
jgi:hypothetical protein